MISGIRWVSELVEIAGGVDVFSELSRSQAATGRIVSSDAVLAREPDVMIASWCGKKFRPQRVRERTGWNAVPAVRDGELHEVKSAEILQPGPAALTDGVRRLQAIISGWAERRCAP
jgi:iron complex transport system substrate-binding protein